MIPDPAPEKLDLTWPRPRARIAAATGDPDTEAGVIVGDYACAGCEYNLRTMRRDGACPECGMVIADTIQKRRAMADRLLHLGRFSVPSRLGYAALGIVLPVICFAAAALETPLDARWQDGHWQTYVQLLYGGWPMIVFWPLLLYAMVALAAMLRRPLEAGRYVIVRFGVYTGLVLAAQYLLVLAVGLNGLVILPATLAGVIGVIAVMHGLRAWLQRLSSRGRWTLLGAAAALALATGVVGWPAVFDTAVGLLFGAAPAWTLLVFALMALRIGATRFERPANRYALPLLGAGWLTAWTGTWSAAIVLAIDAYARLPVTPPSCYIAAAAARGHRRFVGARPVRCGDGRVMLVNRQLRTCRIAELALAATCPRAHRALRAVYDALGPPLAQCIRHPLAADAAYLAIAPLAWSAAALLRAVGCDMEAALKRVYPDDAAG